MTTIALEAARVHWARAQGLAEPLSGGPLSAVERTGWLRTLGCIAVSVARRARARVASRSAIDDLVAAGALRVSMALRSCIYLVPGRHAAIALRFADGLWRKRTERDLDRAGT